MKVSEYRQNFDDTDTTKSDDTTDTDSIGTALVRIINVLDTL